MFHYTWILFLALSFCSHMQGWYGRVLPVSYNDKTETWNLLLGYDKNKKEWTDFKQQSSNSVGLHREALKSLSIQTNGGYNFVNNVPEMYCIQDKESWFCLLEVDYISGRDLYKKAEPVFNRNFMNDFVWVPLNEAIANKVTHKKGGKIDGYLHWFIKNYVGDRLTSKHEKKEEKESEIRQSGWPKPNTHGSVHFYDSKDDYYEFTNTYGVDLTIDGHVWKSSEHYYQAGKFSDPWKAYDKGVNGQTPLKNIGFGQLQKEMPNYSGKISNDEWIKINLSRMLKGLWAKFTQYTHLQKKLLDTNRDIIVENAGKNDAFFGAGADFKGENHLGQMLMQLRDIMVFLKNDGEEIPKEVPKDFVYTPYAPEKYLERYKNKKLMVNLTQKTSKEDIKESIEVVNSFAKSLKSIAKK